MKLKLFLGKLFGLKSSSQIVSWFLRTSHQKSSTRFNLDPLNSRIPQLLDDVRLFVDAQPDGKNVFIFASMHFWIYHIVVTGLALRGLGNKVTIGYLPYGDFTKPISESNLHHNDVYARTVLRKMESLVNIIPFLDQEPNLPLPLPLQKAVEQITFFDTLYILQKEEVSGTEPIYLLRQERNINAAARAMTYLQHNRPDVVIVPNGMIQEFGAIYETARYLGIPVVTYEFGEQDQKIWIGQNKCVIHHLIDELWEERKSRVLTTEQKTWLEVFLGGRQKLDTGQQFAHLWQKVERSGVESIRAQLSLDNRPILLLPTNVLGDSATLGLPLFTTSMTEWLEKVLPVLAFTTEVQVIIRIHPAEERIIGPSVKEIIQQVLPELPPHIHLIGSSEMVNSYDLMDIADLGLVYTTTAGLEMSLRGIPVLVSGKAHYRKKGFTLDADSWDEYLTVVKKAIKSLPLRLTQEQLEIAWNYAYTFFAEYPKPFPWHLESLSRSLEKRPMQAVINPAGREKYERTFKILMGESIE
jgi:hypothetical protein